MIEKVIPVITADLFPVEKEIVDELANSTAECQARGLSNPEWTRKFKAKLAQLGKNHGFKVGTSSLEREEADYGEWLFDLIWIDQGNDQSNTWQEFRGLKLICEIEWNAGKGSILEDFSKLTVGIADFRLMVFTHQNEQKTQEIISICKGICPGSRGFRYLMLGIPDKNKEKRIFAYPWSI